MAIEVVLPKMGMTMVEGTITEWFMQDGDTVAEGDQLFAFETEKVDYEVSADSAGSLRIMQPVDSIVEAGGLVAYILAEGESLPEGAAPAAAPASAPPAAGAAPAAAAAPPAALAVPSGAGIKASPVAKKLAAERGIDLTTVPGSGPGGRILKEDVENAPAPTLAAVGAASTAGANGRAKASPVAKKLAAEHGIDLSRIAGSGPDGRIVKGDVEAAIANPPAASAPLEGSIPYRGIRRTVGQRMFESLQSMAQLTMTMEIDVTDAVRLRRDLVEAWEAEGVRVTYTDMVIKAAALALRDHPRVNAILNEDTVEVQPEVHIGFAVALDEGLIVPVLRHADQTPIKQLAVESAELARKARDGGLTPDELTGGTFNVTSLGMYGVDAFTPIVNPPQAAILGVGGIADRPAFVGDSGLDVERRSFLTISLTIDHRLLDGAPGAQYMQSVRRYLEHPYLLLTTV